MIKEVYVCTRCDKHHLVAYNKKHEIKDEKNCNHCGGQSFNLIGLTKASLDAVATLSHTDLYGFGAHMNRVLYWTRLQEFAIKTIKELNIMEEIGE